MSCSRTQRSDAGEAQTHYPSVLSQALYHCAPKGQGKNIILCHRFNVSADIIEAPLIGLILVYYVILRLISIVCLKLIVIPAIFSGFILTLE